LTLTRTGGERVTEQFSWRGRGSKRSFATLPPGVDWEEVAGRFLDANHLPCYPGYTSLESLRAHFAGWPSGTRYATARTAQAAWWGLVDRTQRP
jgi:hypothetical protein